MNNKNCQLCKNIKDGYCEELGLKPSYPEGGCDYFKPKNNNERRIKKLNTLFEELAMYYMDKYPEEAAKDIVKIVKEINADERND